MREEPTSGEVAVHDALAVEEAHCIRNLGGSRQYHGHVGRRFDRRLHAEPALVHRFLQRQKLLLTRCQVRLPIHILMIDSVQIRWAISLRKDMAHRCQRRALRAAACCRAIHSKGLLTVSDQHSPNHGTSA